MPPPARARLSIYETQRIEGDAVAPVSVGVMVLALPNGQVHRFPIISGGFGKGAAPGMHEDLPSADRARFPGARDVQAVYAIYEAQRPKGEAGMRAGGADFFIRLASPADAKRGRTRAQLDAGLRDSLGIHPDGDTTRDYYDARVRGDGKAADGTNGCFGISPAFAKTFQNLFFALPADQRPLDVYVIAPPLRTPKSTAAQYFPNLRK